MTASDFYGGRLDLSRRGIASYDLRLQIIEVGVVGAICTSGVSNSTVHETQTVCGRPGDPFFRLHLDLFGSVEVKNTLRPIQVTLI